MADTVRLSRSWSAHLRRLGLAGLLLVSTAGDLSAKKIDLAELTESPLELTAPASGDLLVSGTDAEIAWQPTAAFSALAGATEWEAFLSVDGGRSFPVRLTPHLDLERRRVRFRVPDLPSDDVRLLLRVGDERTERAVRLPVHLRLLPAASAALWTLDRALFSGPSLVAGEAPLPGAPGVLFWVEGNRDGTGLRLRTAAPRDAIGAMPPIVLAGDALALASDEPSSSAVAPPRPAFRPFSAPRGTTPTLARLPGRVLDILILVQRLNE